MVESIASVFSRIFTLYFFIITFLSGFICYYILYPSFKKHYPTESKIAKYGGIAYMIGGAVLFVLAKILS